MMILPLELYREIQPFSSGHDFFNWMSTSQQIFEDIKYQILRFRFPLEKMKKGEIITLIKRLEKRVANPNKQINFYFYLRRGNYLEIKKLIDKFPNRQICFAAVDFHGSNNSAPPVAFTLEDFLPFLNIPLFKGDFYYNNVIQSFDGCQFRASHFSFRHFTALTTTAGLGNLQSLEVWSCSSLVNVSHLGRVQRVVITGCHQLSDLSGLGSVYGLTIESCEGIQDISPLTNNYRLKIRFCDHIVSGLQAIRNVSELETDLNIPTEDLVKFPNLEKFHSISLNCTPEMVIAISKTMRILSIYCGSLQDYNISFMSISQRLFSLSLGNCSHISSMDFLSNVPILRLDHIIKLQDISQLGKRNKSVTIVHCHLIKDFSSLMNIPKVRIENCDGFTNGCDVMNVKDLKISRCQNFSDVSMLGNAHRLVLRGYNMRNQIKSLEALKDVPVLELYLCYPFPLPPLGRNEKIICSDGYIDDPLLQLYYLRVENTYLKRK